MMVPDYTLIAEIMLYAEGVWTHESFGTGLWNIRLVSHITHGVSFLYTYKNRCFCWSTLLIHRLHMTAYIFYIVILYMHILHVLLYMHIIHVHLCKSIYTHTNSHHKYIENLRSLFKLTKHHTTYLLSTGHCRPCQLASCFQLERGQCWINQRQAVAISGVAANHMGNDDDQRLESFFFTFWDADNVSSVQLGIKLSWRHTKESVSCLARVDGRENSSGWLGRNLV